MVIDTSAIVAIALDEPEAPDFERRIAGDPVRLISAATVLEAAMVIETRLGEAGGSELDLWLHKADVEIVAVDSEHADQARRAWRRFGKGRHPASLNFGDCFSYALAPDAGAVAVQGRGFRQNRHFGSLTMASRSIAAEIRDEAPSPAPAAPVDPAPPLPARLAPLAETARDYARAAASPNTNRAYAADWRHFSAWARRQNLTTLPPDPQVLGLYIAACASGAAGPKPCSVSTIERRLSALMWNFAQRGQPIDRKDRHVATVLAGIRRTQGRPPEQKEAILPEDLLAMIATLDLGDYAACGIARSS